MDYPYARPYACSPVSNPDGSIALDANVQAVINAIRMHCLVPYGDFGGPVVYYFGACQNGLGNLIYTIFDKHTNLGLASFAVRFGAAATIRQVIFEQFPRAQIDLQFLVLPHIPCHSYCDSCSGHQHYCSHHSGGCCPTTCANHCGCSCHNHMHLHGMTIP